MIEVLPDSRCRTEKGTVWADTPYGRLRHVPIFCANCGKGGPFVTGETTFAFWLCASCSEKWAPMVGTVAIPDEVFFAKLHEEQMETYGRLLSLPELVNEIEDETTSLSKLAKESPGRN